MGAGGGGGYIADILGNGKVCAEGQITQLVQRRIEKPGAILTRVRIPDAIRDLSPSQLPVPVLLCSYSPLVQSHASRFVCSLKIPHNGGLDTGNCCTHWQEWLALFLRLL